MKVLMCAVYDAATGAYMQPHFARTKLEAIRGFSDACLKPEMPFFAHPEDYVLFYIADYDDSNGAVTPLDVTEKLITALECRKPT